MQNVSSACLNSKYMAKGKLLFGNFMRFIRRTCRTLEQLFACFCDMCRLLVSKLVGPRSISCRSLESLRLKMKHLFQTNLPARDSTQQFVSCCSILQSNRLLLFYFAQGDTCLLHCTMSCPRQQCRWLPRNARLKQICWFRYLIDATTTIHRVPSLIGGRRKVHNFGRHRCRFPYIFPLHSPARRKKDERLSNPSRERERAFHHLYSTGKLELLDQLHRRTSQY